MKALLLFALLLSPVSRAEGPVSHSNYQGAIELTPQADGTYSFRLDSFIGAGIVDEAGLLVPGTRYVVTGTVNCEVGANTSMLDCASKIASLPSLRVQVLEGSDGHVVKDVTIEADYYSVVSNLVTTKGVHGSFDQTVVAVNVYSRTLNIDLTLAF